MGNTAAVAQEEKEEQATEDRREGETPTGGGACASPAGVTRSSSHADGLRHHGDPAEPEEGNDGELPEEELEVQEENRDGPPAKLVRAPRTPTQSETEIHEAVHLPHAEWCDNCCQRQREKQATQK